MRLGILLAGVIFLTGCTDYKYGIYWNPSEERYAQQSVSSVNCSIGEINAYRAIESSHQLIAPFFIPLFHNIERSDESIHIKSKGDGCPFLIVKDQYNNVLPHTFQEQDGKGCDYYIEYPKNGDKISVLVVDVTPDCNNHELSYSKDRFFCMRPTEFGGSAPCE